MTGSKDPCALVEPVGLLGEIEPGAETGGTGDWEVPGGSERVEFLVDEGGLCVESLPGSLGGPSVRGLTWTPEQDRKNDDSADPGHRRNVRATTDPGEEGRPGVGDTGDPTTKNTDRTERGVESGEVGTPV